MDASNSKNSISGNTRVILIIVSCVVVFTLVALIALRPDSTVNGINTAQNVLLSVLGPILEIFAGIVMLISVYLGVGKYGKVKLGEGKPEYSTFTYIAMMFMASMASAAIYWAFSEWVYYYTSPGLTFEPESKEALESALGYQFFHWGINFNALYFITGVIIAYAYYIRKVKILQVRSTCEAMLPDAGYKKPLLSIIDFIVIFSIIGGLGVTLGAAIPLLGGGLTQLFGVQVTFPIQVGIILVITAIFTFTSFLGTKKGMANVSTYTGYLCIAFLIYVLFAGPTEFILKNTTNSIGWMLAEFPRMTLYTDPIDNGGFAESWTIFFIAFFGSYCGMMGVFMAKISKGRTIREFTLCSLGGMTVGTMFLFGVLGSVSIDSFLTGKVDVPDLILNSTTGEAGIYKIVETLPGGAKILPVVLVLVIVGFVVSSLDTASLGLAQASTKTVDEKGDANKFLRVFWCVILALVPLSIMYIDAGFGPIKTLAILTFIPFMFMMIFMIINLFRWLKQDSKNGVLEANAKMAAEEKAAWEKE